MILENAIETMGSASGGNVKLIHWVMLAVVLLLIELWVDSGDGLSPPVDFAAACSVLSDNGPFGQPALARVLGETHCAPSIIGLLSAGRVVLWSPVNEDTVSTKRLEANR